MGEDSNGAAVIEAGTILNVKKGGILSVPYGDQAVATKYQDATVHSPNPLGMKARVSGWANLARADHAVFPSRHKSLSRENSGEQRQGSGGDRASSPAIPATTSVPTTFYKADVVFQFAKGRACQDEPAASGRHDRRDCSPSMTAAATRVATATISKAAMETANDQGNNQGGGGGASAAASASTGTRADRERPDS